MTAQISFQDLGAETPDGRALFRNLTLNLQTGFVGIVGRNGCGKSTLMAMIMQRVRPSQGRIGVEGRVDELRQSPDRIGQIVDHFGVRDAFDAVRRLVSGEGTALDANLADWTLDARVGDALRRCGLEHMTAETSLDSLSGGEMMRAELARLLFNQPDILLLDEPTNNLDRDGRTLVRNILKSWNGLVLVASHDRELLESADQIIHLAPTNVSTIHGGWSAYESWLNEQQERAAARLEKAGRELGQINADARLRAERKQKRTRQGKALRASGSQSKLFLDAQKQRSENSGSADAAIAERQKKAAQEELSAARAAIEIVQPLTIRLPRVVLPRSKRILSVRNVVPSHDGLPCARSVCFEITGPERVELAGPNGSGKSTLLNMIRNADSGDDSPITSEASRIAFLDQQVSILMPGRSLLHNLKAAQPHLNDNEARSVLARFAFRGREAERTPETLSGGQRMRAGLACVTAGSEPPDLLILDEPTNHLDVDAVTTLTNALSDFGGAMLLVSHDAHFLR